MEGTRPMLVEIQALASKAGFGTPQRVATGLDHRRLALLLAVLERRGGLPFGSLDVFVNVTRGGPAAGATNHPSPPSPPFFPLPHTPGPPPAFFPRPGGPGRRNPPAPRGRARPPPK